MPPVRCAKDVLLEITYGNVAYVPDDANRMDVTFSTFKRVVSNVAHAGKLTTIDDLKKKLNEKRIGHLYQNNAIIVDNEKNILEFTLSSSGAIQLIYFPKSDAKIRQALSVETALSFINGADPATTPTTATPTTVSANDLIRYSAAILRQQSGGSKL